MSAEYCRCAETSPRPSAFDGIYHWRDDCQYLTAEDQYWVRRAFGPAPNTKEDAAKLADAIDDADRLDGEPRPRGPT